jgi:hypothetical protein
LLTLHVRRILGTFVIATAFWTLSRYVSVEVKEVKADESASASASAAGEGEEEDDEEDYDDALLFLPTGLSRQRPQTFYKGSDPEWQEYKKLAADRPRLDKIRSMCSRFLNAWQRLILRQTS